MKKMIILILIFSTLILGVSYLVIQPSLALDPLQKTNLSYLKYEEDDDVLIDATNATFCDDRGALRNSVTGAIVH